MILLVLMLHLPLLILIAYCWKLDSRRRIVFTPFFLFILVEIIFTWNIWLYFVEHDVKITAYELFIPLVATFSFCLGYMFFTKYISDVCLYPHSAHQLEFFLSKPIDDSAKGTIKVLLIVLALIGFFFGSVYYQGLPPTARGLLRMYAEEEINYEVQKIVTQGRLEITKAHYLGGTYRGQGVLRGFMVGAWNFGLLLSIVALATYRKARWKLAVLFFFIGALYYVAGAGERSRFVWVMVSGLIVISFVSRIRIKHLVLVSVLFIMFVIGMSILLNRYDPVQADERLIGNVVQSIANRILAGYKINNVRVMNFLSDGQLHFTLGKTHIIDFLNVLPGIQYTPLAYDVGQLIAPGKTTYYSGTYLGTVFIDFGFTGVFVIYFLLGCLIRLSFHYLMKMPKDLLNLAFISLTVLNLGRMGLMSGIFSFVSGMVPVVLIYGIARIITNVLTIPLGSVTWNTPPVQE